MLFQSYPIQSIHSLCLIHESIDRLIDRHQMQIRRLRHRDETHVCRVLSRNQPDGHRDEDVDHGIVGYLKEKPQKKKKYGGHSQPQQRINLAILARSIRHIKPVKNGILIYYIAFSFFLHPNPLLFLPSFLSLSLFLPFFLSFFFFLSFNVGSSHNI